jgi:hypothetical protein
MMSTYYHKYEWQQNMDSTKAGSMNARSQQTTS